MNRYLLLFFLVLLNAESNAQWVKKGNAQKKRSETTSVVYQGKIYTFLGFRDSLLNVEPTAEVYDPATDTWKLLKAIDSNKSVTHQGVVLVDDNVWHIGGRVGKNPGVLTHEIWIYNITNNTWTKGPNIVDPVSNTFIKWAGGGAALLGRTIHIFGGFVSTACKGDQSKYHLTLDVDQYLLNPAATKWKNELAPMPVPRNHLSTVVLGGKIYAVGGQFGHDCGGGADHKYSHVYNPITNVWSALPHMPLPRSHAEGGSFACDGKLYITAGQSAGVNNKNSCDRVTIFDPAKNTWVEDSTTMKLPGKYEGISAKIVNSNFIISHGGEGASHNTRNTAYSRPIQRSPVYKIVSPVDTVNISLRKGDSTLSRISLSTLNEPVEFRLSGSEKWLSLVDTAGVAVPTGTYSKFKIRSTGLETGTYYATINVSVNAPYASKPYVVRLSVVLPALRINNPSVWEKNAGTNTAVPFTVTLDRASNVPVYVNYTSAHKTTSNADVTLKNGTLTFPVNTLTQKINLPLFGDNIDEINETVTVTLSSPVNASIASAVGTGNIADDDNPPTVSVYDTFAAESKLNMIVRFGLSAISAKTITVLFDTKNGTAIAPGDYTSFANGKITFSAGELNKTFAIPIKNDGITEPAESFSVVLKSPANATLGRTTAALSIYNGSSSAALLDDPQKLATITPNPFRYQFAVRTDRQVCIRVFDVAGSLVEARTFSGMIYLGATYRSGLYTIKISDGKENASYRLLKK